MEEVEKKESTEKETWEIIELEEWETTEEVEKWEMMEEVENVKCWEK